MKNPEILTLDPVCGMTVTPGVSKGGSHAHAGKVFYFCSVKCRERFAADPEKYLARDEGAASTPEPVVPGATSTPLSSITRISTQPSGAPTVGSCASVRPVGISVAGEVVSVEP